jgi:hypothetical protein
MTSAQTRSRQLRPVTLPDESAATRRLPQISLRRILQGDDIDMYKNDAIEISAGRIRLSISGQSRHISIQDMRPGYLQAAPERVSA